MSDNYTRRTVLAAGAGIAAAGAILGEGVVATPALAKAAVSSAVAKKNVLFIAIDDMNDWNGWLGGYPGVKTPNLDRLAKLITGFRKAYTPAPACQAARAAILFGVEPFKTGVYTNHTANWMDTVLADRTSIPRFFKNAGYDTIGQGKIFHSGWRGPKFDSQVANDSSAWTQYDYSVAPDDGKESLVWGADGRSIAQMEDVKRAKWIADNVLKKKRNKPFFAALGIRKPHMPWFGSDDFFKMYPIDKVNYPLGALDTANSTVKTNKDTTDLPGGGIRMIEQHTEDHRKIIAGKGWKSAVQAYLAMVSAADYAVGIALDALMAGPNASNTIICVWSDHGWQLGEKLAWRKFTLWERAMRIPMLIGGAGYRAGPSDALISGIDIYPTLAEMAVGVRPPGLDGVSFNGYLTGSAEPRKHVIGTWALNQDVGNEVEHERHFTIRTQTHRMIAYWNGARELYDHRNDPWEWKNFGGTTAGKAVMKDLMPLLPTISVEPATRGGKPEDED